MTPHGRALVRGAIAATHATRAVGFALRHALTHGYPLAP